MATTAREVKTSMHHFVFLLSYFYLCLLIGSFSNSRLVAISVWYLYLRTILLLLLHNHLPVALHFLKHAQFSLLFADLRLGAIRDILEVPWRIESRCFLQLRRQAIHQFLVGLNGLALYLELSLLGATELLGVDFITLIDLLWSIGLEGIGVTSSHILMTLHFIIFILIKNYRGI